MKPAGAHSQLRVGQRLASLAGNPQDRPDALDDLRVFPDPAAGVNLLALSQQEFG